MWTVIDIVIRPFPSGLNNLLSILEWPSQSYKFYFGNNFPLISAFEHYKYSAKF